MIGQWISEAAGNAEQTVIPLSTQVVNALVLTIRSRFVNDTRSKAFLWDSFRDEVAVQDPDGWLIAAGYPEPEPILLFLDGDSFVAYRFASSSALQRVLADSPGFEFYLTNPEASFVLCFNHHDVLIGVGDCLDWLRQRSTP